MVAACPWSTRLLFAAGFVLISHGALAYDPPFSDIPPYLLEQMIREGTLDDYMKRLKEILDRADRDGNGLSLDDLTIVDQVQAAQQRAHRVELLVIADLDGNGEVPREEARRAANYRFSGHSGTDDQRRKYVDTQLDSIMAMDSNGDGTVTLTEALTVPEPPKGAWRNTEQTGALLALDPDKDGVLTLAELKELMTKAFREADYDQDGRLSDSEVKLLEAAREFQRKVKEASPCDLPKPGAGDLFAVLGIYDGALQPDITVAGQNESTKMIEVEIVPGSQPIYLVLSAFRPTIWQLEGAVDRVTQAVVIRSRALGQNVQLAHAGVIGLSKDKVTFLPPQNCGYFWDGDDARTKVAAAVIGNAAGRRPDLVHALTNATAISLLSGSATGGTANRKLIVVGKNKNLVVGPNQGPNVTVIESGSIQSLIEQEEWAGASANLVHVDLDSVVAPGSVEPYEVLPESYGIRQLVKEGKLQRTDKGYRIIQPIKRFPAELTGGHSVTFLLPEGMPMPAGNAGHSKIILEPKSTQ